MNQEIEQTQSGECENANVHGKVARECEIDGYTNATNKGRTLHYSLYRCPQCGCQWAYFYDINANKLEKISVDEFQRCRYYN